MKGSLFLVPTYLSANNDHTFLAPMVLDVIKNTTYFVVENVRTSRRFISSLQLGLDISSLRFEVLDKKSASQQVEDLMKPLHDGQNIGIISEAGLPGLADPGSLAVAYAHQSNIRVIPLPGTSAIQTAVIGSGFSGQQFTFHGYLPIQKPERAKAIKSMVHALKNTGYTQVFMETPFRNMSLFKDLIQILDGNVLLSISADIFGDNELIKTQTIQHWKKSKIDIHKLPAVFCLGHMA